MQLNVMEANVTTNGAFVSIVFDDSHSLGECLGESMSLAKFAPNVDELDSKLQRIREIAASCVGSCDSADALLLALSLIERVAENEDALGELADTVEQIKKVLTA